MCLINGMCVISAEAILNTGTSSEYNKSTLFSSKGVEKHVIDFFLAYSKISFHSSVVKQSKLEKTSCCDSLGFPSSQYFGANLEANFDAS